MTVLDNGAAGDGALAPDATDLARRWRESVEANDMDAFGSLYTSDATVFTNLEGASHPLSEHLSRVSRARGASSSWAYSDVRCQRTETGFVSEHTVRVRTDDGEFVTTAAIVGRVRDGRIAELSEYLTKPRRA